MLGVIVLGLLRVDAGHMPWSSDFEVDDWSVADGLPQTSLTGITEDEGGFLWVAT